MIELTVRLDNIDYFSLAEYLVPLMTDQIDRGGILGSMMAKNPNMATGIVKTILGKMTQEQRDEFLCQQLEKNRDALIRKGTQAAARQRIQVQICDVSARKL